MLFIETDSPPPFYQPDLSSSRRQQLDQWYIGHRSQTYYLKRFAEFDQQGYLSPKWHWAAFFMTFPWLLYRKRYMDALVYSVAGWSFIQLNITIILVAFETLAMPFINDAYQMPIRIALAALVWLFWSAMVARWSDAYYYRMARREIADALEKYPNNVDAQKSYLRLHGGVSMVGLGLGFGFYAFALLVIQVQFLPLYAKQKEKEVVFEAYEITYNAQRRVDLIYQQQGKCPITLPLSTAQQRVTLKVATSAAGVPNNSDCVVIATVQGVGYPNRYLNNQTLVMYRQPTGNWGCMSSLNKKQAPKGCL